jgi:GNAT superfamily N-acetyltransferase
MSQLAGLDGPELRQGRMDEVDAIDELMKASMRVVFPQFYDAEQTESSLRFISLDPYLIEDGTYFVIEADGVLVACGGWTRRPRSGAGWGNPSVAARVLDPKNEPARVRQMFVRPDWLRRGLATRILQACEAAARAEGYRELSLTASLPGEPLYLRSGFREVERVDIPLPDGRTLDVVTMTKPIV